MFKTPENTSGNTSPSSTVRDSDLTPPCTTMDISELRTPEESGMVVNWKEIIKVYFGVAVSATH